MKVFTCDSDSSLTRDVPTSTPKLKFYNEKDKPCTSFEILKEDLQKLVEKVYMHVKNWWLMNINAKF